MSLRQKLFEEGGGGVGESCCGTGDFGKILSEILDLILLTNCVVRERL